MRRSPIAALCGGGLVVACGVLGFAAPASAHLCPVIAEVPVGQPATVTVAITVESVETPDVEISVPPQLHVERFDPVANWTAAVEGQTIRMHGPAFGIFTCQYVSIGVTATAKGAYSIAVIQRDAQGKVVARSTTDPSQKLNPLFEQVVYAGVKPPSTKDNGGPSIVLLAGGGLVAFGVVAMIVIAMRSRRTSDDSNDDREAELQERLASFKSQTTDRENDARPAPEDSP